MTNMPLQVMTSRQRSMIPDDFQLLFSDWSDDALLSLSRDELVPLKIKAYAGWELDFRNAFGIEVPFPELPEVLKPWSKIAGGGAGQVLREAGTAYGTAAVR